MNTIRRAQGMAAIAALAIGVAGFGRAQSNPPAEQKQQPAAEKKAEAAPKPAAEEAKKKGAGEGIQVHGHWTIEVKDPDGKVAVHREFENSLATSAGASVLGNLLLGYVVPGGFAVTLQEFPTTGGVLILNICSAGGCPAGASGQLTAGPLTNGLSLSGQVVSTTSNPIPAGNIVGVLTQMYECFNTASPTTLSTISPTGCTVANGVQLFTSASLGPPHYSSPPFPWQPDRPWRPPCRSRSCSSMICRPHPGRAVFRLVCALGFIATARAQLTPSVDAHAPPAPTGAVQAYASLPMTFEANQGQADPRVKFLSRGPGYTLFLTQKEAVLSLVQPEKNPRLTSVVRLKFAGSKRATPITGRNLLRAKSNYFLGKDPLQWHTNVPNYAGAAYQGIYPGVDAVFHGNGKHLEFDFAVAPGANPGEIGIEIQGSKRLRVNSQGDIVLSVGSAAEVVLAKPRVYQEVEGQRREIAGKFAPHGPHRIGFSVGRYDHSLPLVIDPTLAYSTYVGGNSVDQVNGVAVDASNDAYIVGTTNSSNFPTFSPASSGAYQSTCYACASVSVAFVAKLDPSQSGPSSLIYSTFVGPQGPASMPDLLGSSTGNAIVVDPSGDAYITGQANSNYFPATQTKNASSCGAFVAELDPNGANLLGSSCVGSSSDQGNAIVQDSLLNIYVGGTTGTSGLAVPTATAVPPAVQTVLNGSHTPFVAKFSPGLTLNYFTYLGGSVLDAGLALAVDAEGEAYLAGVTYSTTFPTISNQYGTN